MSELDALIEAAREYRRLNPMTDEERSGQARSFAYGNVAMHNPAVTRETVKHQQSGLTLGEMACLARSLGGDIRVCGRPCVICEQKAAVTREMVDEADFKYQTRGPIWEYKENPWPDFGISKLEPLCWHEDELGAFALNREDTIERELILDALAADAQANDMGY